MIKATTLALAGAAMLGLSSLVQAAGSGFPLESPNIDVGNERSLQRGARTYVNYCMTCHSLSYMRYARVAQDLGIPPKAMPNVFWQMQGTQAPVYEEHDDGQGHVSKTLVGFEPVTAGTQSAQEFDKTVTDLVNFLSYAAEPGQERRRSMGMWVLLARKRARAIRVGPVVFFNDLAEEPWRETVTAITRRSVMTLFSVPTDLHSHRVRVVLFEKDIVVEIEDVNPNALPAEVLEVNPSETMPTLVDRECAVVVAVAEVRSGSAGQGEAHQRIRRAHFQARRFLGQPDRARARDALRWLKAVRP